MKKNLIIEKLRILQNALSSSGKRDAAGFFSQLCERVERMDDYPTVLQEIVSCGAIVQYADFDASQTARLEQLIKLSEEELISM